MTDFPWEEHHIDWFLKKFSSETKELVAREVHNSYKPKKGEPRKGRSKEGEPIFDLQDFRNLMRLIVLNKYARVTKGSFKSTKYRIRMVSDEYPYIQELFDKEFFDHDWIVEPMPDIEVVRNIYLPFIDEWTDLHQEAHDIAKQDGYTYFDAFYIYNYRGGDFDILFHQFPKFDTRSKDGSDARELFILHVYFFISVYKAFIIGLHDLKKWFKAIDPSRPCPRDHNTFFAVMFNHHIVGRIVTKVGVKDWKVSHGTLSNNMSELGYVLELSKLKGQKADLLEKMLSSLERGFNPGKKGRHYLYLGYANEETNALRSSERPEVRKAVEEVDDAFSKILSFFKTRFDRSRNPKRSTNVG
jgi:hypothetical protein